MKIINRKFNREYQEVERVEAGIVLSGAEVKSVRLERIKLDDAFVKIVGEEVFLINAEISPYEHARASGYDPRRTRKLLLHKKEIIRLRTKLLGGGHLTMAPLACYNKGPFIKVEIALAKGRKDIEKRKLVKHRDIERAEKREVKEYMKN